MEKKGSHDDGKEEEVKHIPYNFSKKYKVVNRPKIQCGQITMTFYFHTSKIQKIYKLKLATN